MATQSSQLFPFKEQFPSSISNHNLQLKKYWNGGNKILRANLACSFILPPQLSNLETSSKQPSPVNILASNTNSAEASTHPALLLGVGRGFCFVFSYLAWLSSHESHSPCALSHPWFPFYSQLYSLLMLLCVNTLCYVPCSPLKKMLSHLLTANFFRNPFLASHPPPAYP